MPRKIKVVPVAEMEIKQDPIVEIPNEPTPTEISSNQSVEVNVDPEPPKPEEVIQTEDEIKVTTNKEELVKNKAPTGTCELCGKTMLLKNLICTSQSMQKQTTNTTTTTATNTKYNN